MDLAEYYAQELARLRVTAQAFARRNPGSAGHLLERGNDPDVERLLEGVAFLIAGFRARVDQTTNQVAQHVAEISAPHIVRSLPAATIVEFTAHTGALTKRHVLERGRLVESTPNSGTACRFQTTCDVDLWPLEVVDAKLERVGGSRAQISIKVALGRHGAQALNEVTPLRFFLHHHSDPTLAPTLLLWLGKHLQRLWLRDEYGGERELPIDAIQLLDPSSFPVFPWPETSPIGYRSVVEYFAFPEKFHFFELHGLHKVAPTGTAFVLGLEFKDMPRLATGIDARTFRLHCVPAINLYPCPGEPIRRDPVARESLLRADDVNPEHMEVYDVVSVNAYSRRRGEREYSPINSFGVGRPGTRRVYSLRREPAVADEGIDTFITLFDGDQSEVDAEDISVELRCTNRRLADRLRVGDIRGSSQQALYRSYVNITRVSAPVRLAVHSEGLWLLASHLSIGQVPPQDVKSLHRILALFDFVGQEKTDVAQFNRRQIDAVLGVKVQPDTWILDGVPIPALLVTVELEDSALGGPGGAHLLGLVLDTLYGSFAPLNTAMKLRVTLASTATEYTWPIRLGT